jgi:hypothetical protein
LVVADQVDDGLVRAKRPASPIDRNEREKPVFDLVPLARPRREVADVDGEVELVGEALKLGFQTCER